MEQTKKKYNPEIPFFPMKRGEGFRIFVDASVYDNLQKAEIGTSLCLYEVPESRRQAAEAKGKMAPRFHIVIMPPMENSVQVAKTKTVTKKVTTEDELE